MKLDSLMKLYVKELKDLYSAEKQIVDALPRMARAAEDEELERLFRSHLAETKNHVGRLETIFEGLEFGSAGHHCRGIEGLLEEGEELVQDRQIEPSVRDAALVAAAQRVEHYEIAGYGVARTLAEKLGHYEAADLLQETLNEEALADQRLTRLAERRINFEALTA